MGQRNLWKNVTGTVVAMGVVLASMNFKSTGVVPSVSNDLLNNWSINDYKNNSSTYSNSINNYYVKNSKNTLMEEAGLIFGQMRAATYEEKLSINQYIERISKETGVDFFDLC